MVWLIDWLQMSKRTKTRSTNPSHSVPRFLGEEQEERYTYLCNRTVQAERFIRFKPNGPMRDLLQTLNKPTSLAPQPTKISSVLVFGWILMWQKLKCLRRKHPWRRKHCAAKLLFYFSWSATCH